MFASAARCLAPLGALMLTLCLSGNAQRVLHTRAATPREARAIRAFNAARQSPLQLRAFLVGMPKGADLHMHLSGAIYAETFLRDAAADNLCVDPKALTLQKNAGTSRSIPPQAVCAEGNVRADSVFKDQHLYDQLVDSFSMRSFVPSAGWSGHDQFFATFARFGGIDKSHGGEWLDEVASRAAAQNEQYLEIMQTPSFSHAVKLAYEIGWPTPRNPAQPPGYPAAEDTSGTSTAELSALRDKLLAGGLRDDLAPDRAELHSALDARNEIEHCGEPNAALGCTVKIRFMYQVLRAFPPEQVFAQTLLGFELAASDPDVVGINFVQPEDAFMAMSEYSRQMRMLDYLHSVYPQVHISLHAGEIAPGLVPPNGLKFHIREAVDLGHAERIGHGVDVMYEQDPEALLKEMAERHIMVEINITSNDVILGVSLNRHSLPAYRAARVPVALSTDDEGVSRIDLTHEYARAATDFNLSYLDLKRMARTSLEHSFLPGRSLWATADDFTRTDPACAAQQLGSDNPSSRCLAFLNANQRAAEQWQLEHRYGIFESTLP
jgi:adenosine deaminase